MVYADYISVQLSDLIVTEPVMINYGLACHLKVQVNVEFFEIIVNVSRAPRLKAISPKQNQVTCVLLLLPGIIPVNKAVFALRRPDDLMGANCTVRRGRYPHIISQANVLRGQVQKTYQTAHGE